MEEGVLGSASWTNREVILNSDNEDSIVYLNDVSYSLNCVVLLHETLHVLGLVGVDVNENISEDISYSYVGKCCKGIQTTIK